MESFTIAEVAFVSIPVRAATEWVFVELSDRDGCTGLAEITGPGASTEVARALAQMADELRDHSITNEAEIPELAGLSIAALKGDRVLATAVSGIRSAVLDAQAQRAGMSLTEYLGGTSTLAVELYANINRSMLPDDDGPVDRSPRAFAEMAARVKEEGFKTVKCAPFDECRAPFPEPGLPEEAKPGLERIAAVREALGPDVTLLVDCHSRFDLESALALEERLFELNVGWFEEPVDPLKRGEDLSRIKEAARMPVAGAETGYGARTFAGLIESKTLDVVMPDVKYCGGVGEAVATGCSLEPGWPGRISLHSPSGPVSLLGGGHATAVFSGVRPLEHAVHEVPWRATVLQPVEKVEEGKLIPSDAPGLGARLNENIVQERGLRWTL